MSREDHSIKSIVPGNALAAKVQKSKRFPNGDINRAIGKWKRALKDAGTLQELRDRRYFKKKSTKRREQLDNAKYFQQINSKEQ